MEVKDNLDAIFSHLENLFSSKTVIGDPITIGEVTLIPVVSVAFGMGTGTGEGKGKEIDKDRGGSAVGVGTGAKVSPIAVIVIRGSEVSMLPIAGRGTLDGILEKIPEVIDKFTSQKEKREEK